MILLIVLALLNPTPPACRALPVVTPSFVLSSDPRWTTADIYATVPVSATNGLITDTITLDRPWQIRWPPRAVTTFSPAPYTLYNCRAGQRPHRMYLGLLRS